MSKPEEPSVRTYDMRGVQEPSAPKLDTPDHIKRCESAREWCLHGANGKAAIVNGLYNLVGPRLGDEAVDVIERSAFERLQRELHVANIEIDAKEKELRSWYVFKRTEFEPLQAALEATENEARRVRDELTWAHAENSKILKGLNNYRDELTDARQREAKLVSALKNITAGVPSESIPTGYRQYAEHVLAQLESESE